MEKIKELQEAINKAKGFDESNEEEYRHCIRVLIDTCQKVVDIAGVMPEKEEMWNPKMCIITSPDNKIEIRNDTVDQCTLAIAGGYIKREDIKLCKCRNNDEGAMTVKVINDDFFKCPRCEGLMPRDD